MRFLADENLNGRLVRGLLRRLPSVDCVRVQDLPLAGSDDRSVLAWAAREERLLLTHDRRTIPAFALERLSRGQPLAGVIVISDSLPPGPVIDDLVVVATCSSQDEWVGRIVYFPL